MRKCEVIFARAHKSLNFFNSLHHQTGPYDLD
jgi:hypothetical protein